MIISFYECEHTGDLGRYVGDLLDCNAIIKSSRVDIETEIGYVEIDTPNGRKQFLKDFEETESWGFSSLNRE